MPRDQGTLFFAGLRRLAAVSAVGLLIHYPTTRLTASPITSEDAAIASSLPNLEAMLGASLPLVAPATLAPRADTRAREPLGLSPPRVRPLDSADAAAAQPDRVPPGSLKNILRTLATIRRGPSKPAALGPERVILTEADYFDPLGQLLESEVVGNALRAVTEVKTTDGEFTIFSVLGMGDFVLEMRGDAQSAIFYELSTGWSLTLTSGWEGGGLLGYAAGPAHSDGHGAGERERINLVQLVWQWLVEILTSPLGVLAMMIVGVIFFMWALRRTIALMQRRALGSRR